VASRCKQTETSLWPKPKPDCFRAHQLSPRVLSGSTADHDPLSWGRAGWEITGRDHLDRRRCPERGTSKARTTASASGNARPGITGPGSATPHVKRQDLPAPAPSWCAREALSHPGSTRCCIRVEPSPGQAFRCSLRGKGQGSRPDPVWAVHDTRTELAWSATTAARSRQQKEVTRRWRVRP
jgi:hypothetical protein